MRRLSLLAALVLPVVLIASAGQPVAAGSRTARLRPVGSNVLTDAQAASHVRGGSWEPRPSNALENSTVPTASQLKTFDSFTGQWGNCDDLRTQVTGNFEGTTDQIIQWAAWKWGLPENVVRATAVTESWWKMSTVGDNGLSFGLMQIKNVSKWHGGTYPLSQTSTAFNVDYWAGMVRQYYEGCSTWMKGYTYNGSKYAAGDLWGSIGAWYSGDWHSNAAHNYISHVKKHLKARTWKSANF
jgi:hypothetical protein